MKHLRRLAPIAIVIGSAAAFALPVRSVADVPAVADVGARLPFVTREAESPENSLVGSGARIVRMTAPPARIPTPGQEASGRAFVELAATGDTLEIPVAAEADSIVIRHCIPDAPDGGGIDATITLLVNGQTRQSLALSSRHNWLYGAPGQNGQDSTPSPEGAHVFWEETRAFVTGPALQPGDRLQLRKTPDDTAAYYRIDLVDLELAGPPLPPPPEGTYLDVRDNGAKGDGVTDDTGAIAATIAAARLQNKIVWIPAGTWIQTQRLTLDGPVIVRGAGMWHTRIVGTVAGTTWAGNMGFHLTGDGPALADLFMESAVHTNRASGAKPVTGDARNWRVERLWITHTNVGLWMSGASHGVVRDCRIRFTYADGINLNRGASHNLVENNHIRGCGDDGIAFLSETGRNDPPSTQNTARHNTVTCIWWGHNMDLAGGSGHVMENNYLADNALMGAFTVNMTGSYPNHPVSRSVFRRNVLERGGGDYSGQKRGAIWIYAGDNTITDIEVSGNRIVSPYFRAFDVTGKKEQRVTFDGNRVELAPESAATTDVVHVGAGVTGSGVFSNNTAIGLPAGRPAIVNRSPATWTVEESGNQW
ncbi:hypothetical protein OPIT5_08415 [Opitutaceae bacterium TAV5]|nr:hypothetical protein OPIT5_08415 [Opitutaceae bacterium TAV5]